MKSLRINAHPATDFGVRDLAVPDRTLAGPKFARIECLRHGFLRGDNASSPHAVIGSIRKPVVEIKRSMIDPSVGYSRRINPSPATNFNVRVFAVSRWPVMGIKFSCLKGVNDGFLFDWEAGNRKASLCPFGEATFQKY